MNYEKAKLLLTNNYQENLTQREKELENCLREIQSDNLLVELPKWVRRLFWLRLKNNLKNR